MVLSLIGEKLKSDPFWFQKDLLPLQRISNLMSKQMILICTNDNKYLSKLKTKLSGMDIISIEKLSDDKINDIDFVIVDCLSFDKPDFEKYSDILYLLWCVSIIFVRETTYIDYPSWTRVSVDMIFSDNDNDLVDIIKTVSNRKEVGVYRFGKWVMNTLNEELIYNNGEYKVHLSGKNFYVLQELVLNFGNVVPRDKLLLESWGVITYKKRRSMDALIVAMKKYFKVDPTIEIVNVYGEGYKIRFKKQFINKIENGNEEISRND